MPLARAHENSPRSSHLGAETFLLPGTLLPPGAVRAAALPRRPPGEDREGRWTGGGSGAPQLCACILTHAFPPHQPPPPGAMRKDRRWAIEEKRRGSGLQSALPISEDIATLLIQGHQSWQGRGLPVSHRAAMAQAPAPVSLTALPNPLRSWSQHEAYS